MGESQRNIARASSWFGSKHFAFVFWRTIKFYRMKCLTVVLDVKLETFTAIWLQVDYYCYYYD